MRERIKCWGNKLLRIYVYFQNWRTQQTSRNINSVFILYVVGLNPIPGDEFSFQFLFQLHFTSNFPPVGLQFKKRHFPRHQPGYFGSIAKSIRYFALINWII
jgi:hypothetical protein